MTKLIAVLLVLASCGTKRSTLIATGIGAGFVISGSTVFALSPDGNETLSGGQGAGILLVGGGLVTIAASLINLGFLALGKAGSGTPSKDASGTPGSPRCMPIDASSTSWSCGPGYRCTDSFEDCEPAEGAPVRQR